MAIKISEYTQELTTFDTPETIKQEVSMETSPSVYETKWYSWTTLKNFFTLKNVLLIGNETLGTNIKVNDADAIELENTSTLKKGTYDFGASGGISRICGVGYEDMWQAGIHHVFDSNGLIRESNNCFNIIPDGSFDGTQRFKVGSRWILDDGTVYVCTAIPSAGNAVWEEVLQPYFIDANSNVFLYGTQSSNLGSNCNLNTFSDGNITLGDTCNYNTFEPAMGGPVIFGNNLLNTTVKSGTAGANYTASPNYDFMYNLYYPSQIFRNPENDANYHSYYDPTNDRIVLTNLTTLVVSYIGGGDVVGPASATTDNIAVYDGTTGKIIKDGGATIAGINTNAVDLVTVKLSEAISKGQAVYISGANGTNILVSKADNTTEATSSKTIGLLQTSGALNAIVNIVTNGLLDGLNTSTATVGDPVYLGTSGNLIYGIANEPVAPAHLVYIGIVTRVSATVGEIFVNVINGFKLSEIHDVLITSVADKDVLQYESATTLWKNKALTTASVAASTDKNYVTDAQAVVIGNTSGTNTGDQNLSTLMVKANNLSDLTNTSTARTNLGLDNRSAVLAETATDGAATTGVAVTGILNTYSTGVLITPAMIDANTSIMVKTRVRKVGVSGTVTVRIYANVTNDIAAGGILIGTYTSGATTLNSMVQRDLAIKVKAGTGTGTEVQAALISGNTEYANLTTVVSNLAIDWTSNKYIVVAVQNSVAADVSVISFLKVSR